MLKSILTSLALGVVVGLFLSGYALVKGKAVDVKTTLLFCGMSTAACLFLTLRDSLQAKAVRNDREWNDLQGSSDPFIALINADTTLCLKRIFGSVTSEYFEIHWVVNSTTFDFNTSVISLTAKKPMAASVARQEVNRIAYQYLPRIFSSISNGRGNHPWRRSQSTSQATHTQRLFGKHRNYLGDLCL